MNPQATIRINLSKQRIRRISSNGAPLNIKDNRSVNLMKQIMAASIGINIEQQNAPWTTGLVPFFKRVYGSRQDMVMSHTEKILLHLHCYLDSSTPPPYLKKHD